MSVKEIRELEDEVCEVSGNEKAKKKDEVSWEEKNFVDESAEEDKEEDKEKFSIGDTMLARGSTIENWGGSSLEEELEGEEFDRVFDDSVLEEEEEFGEEGFSYETMGQGGVGDMYGSSTGGLGDMYGASTGGVGDMYGNSVGGQDLYGASGKRGSDSVSMYNTSSGGNEGSMYNTGSVGKGKKSRGITYDVAGPKKKGGRGKKSSALEAGVMGGPKRRAKSISMI